MPSPCSQLGRGCTSAQLLKQAAPERYCYAKPVGLYSPHEKVPLISQANVRCEYEFAEFTILLIL